MSIPNIHMLLATISTSPRSPRMIRRDLATIVPPPVHFLYICLYVGEVLGIPAKQYGRGQKLQNVQYAYIVKKINQGDVLPQLHSDDAIGRDSPVHHRASTRRSQRE